MLKSSNLNSLQYFSKIYLKINNILIESHKVCRENKCKAVFSQKVAVNVPDNCFLQISFISKCQTAKHYIHQFTLTIL